MTPAKPFLSHTNGIWCTTPTFSVRLPTMSSNVSSFTVINQCKIQFSITVHASYPEMIENRFPVNGIPFIQPLKNAIWFITYNTTYLIFYISSTFLHG